MSKLKKLTEKAVCVNSRPFFKVGLAVYVSIKSALLSHKINFIINHFTKHDYTFYQLPDEQT